MAYPFLSHKDTNLRFTIYDLYADSIRIKTERLRPPPPAEYKPTTAIHERMKPLIATARQSRKQNPKAMGHGLHGFSRIKQSKHIRKSEQSNPSSLNKNLAQKQDFAG